MKAKLLIIAVLVTLAIACSKKDTPAPDPPVNPPNGGVTESFGVTSFSPASGVVGSTVTIKGLAFGTDANQVTIKFTNAVAVKPATITNSELTVTVPADAQTGTIQVALSSGKSATTSTSFTVTPVTVIQTITGFSPKTVTKGDVLKITGTNFGTSTANVLVYLNRTGSDYGTKPTLVTPTEIDVVVPSNTVTGKFNVSVQGQGMVTASESLTYIPPTSVASVSPASARAGEIVAINGDFLTTEDFTALKVRFAGSATDVIPLKNDGHNNILVRVPADAANGAIQVTKPGYATGSTLNTFTVLSPLPAVQSGTWTVRPDLPTSSGRAGAFAFTIGTKAYVGTGTSNAPFDGYGSVDVWEWDQSYNGWTQKADFAGGARFNAVAFSIATKGYVGTGLNGSNQATSDFWQYDPDANTWAQKASFAGGVRTYAVGFAANGAGYIGTGTASSGTGSPSKNDFYKYDPVGNSWTAVASMPGIRCQALSFVIGSNAYVGNGIDGTTVKSDFYQYDPAGNTWTAKASIPSFSCYGGSAFAIGNNGYAGLGLTVVNSTVVSTNKVYQYSASGNSWTAIASFGGSARTTAVGYAIGNIGYFASGTSYTNNPAIKDIWAYTP